MARVQWHQLVMPTASLHKLVASQPQGDDDDGTGAPSLQMLFNRLLKGISLAGRYAVVISRHSADLKSSARLSFRWTPKQLRTPWEQVKRLRPRAGPVCRPLFWTSRGWRVCCRSLVPVGHASRVPLETRIDSGLSGIHAEATGYLKRPCSRMAAPARGKVIDLV